VNLGFDHRFGQLMWVFFGYGIFLETQAKKFDNLIIQKTMNKKLGHERKLQQELPNLRHSPKNTNRIATVNLRRNWIFLDPHCSIG
jgi:hypothetical protein